VFRRRGPHRSIHLRYGAKMRAPEDRVSGRFSTRARRRRAPRPRGLRPCRTNTSRSKPTTKSRSSRTADGTLAKDDRPSPNYSPSFKRHVARRGAVAYIAGSRDAPAWSATAVTRFKGTLVKSFCDDIGLLRSVGCSRSSCTAAGPDPARASTAGQPPTSSSRSFNIDATTRWA